MKVELGGYTSIELHNPTEGTFLDASRATGKIIFSSKPQQDDWVMIDDIKFTFSNTNNGDVVPYEAPPRASTGRFGSYVPRLIKIDDDIKNTVENLLVSIKFNTKLNMSLFVGQEEQADKKQAIFLINRKCGIIGNTLEISKSSSGSFSLSDATLTGGSDYGGNRFDVARAFIPHETGTIKIQTPKSIRGEDPAYLNREGNSCAPGNTPVDMFVTAGTLYPIVTCGSDSKISVLR
jgi:hypothetical protein